MASPSLERPSEDVIAFVLQDSKRLVKKNRIEEAIAELEKVLPECESANISSFTRVAARIATLCNLQSSSRDTQNSVPKLLRTAEHVLQSISSRRKRENLGFDEAIFRLILLTYNNWATFHKEKRNYHMALNYLMRAGKMIEENERKFAADTLEYCAKTRLNIAALYSDLRRYREAIEFAEQCLSTLQQELNTRLNGRQLEDLSSKEKEKFNIMISTYVVAFFNIGVAEESLGQGMNAVQAYHNAVNIGSKFLPQDNPELAMARAALASTPQRVDSQRSSTQPLESETYKQMLSARLQGIRDLMPTDPSPKSDLPHSASAFLTSQESDRPALQLHPKAAFQADQFKYYTPERLENLHQRFTKGEKVAFVSADKFFLTKITNNLNVTQDIKHMRPLSA